jgi:RNA polymerase sigma-70 factor (ECF subfamily)
MCNEAGRRYTSLHENRYARPVPPESPVSALEDGALARRIAAAGAVPDSAAETELYRRLAPRVRLYGLRHLREPHAAADLVQQVLLMTLERLRAGEVREPERIASFVLGACRMTVLEMRRGARRRDELLETWGGAEEAYEAPEPLVLDPGRLAACLQALSERERSVVVLTFFSESPAEQVGAELNLTAGNVRVVRHRALGRLRECMELRD